MYDLKDYFLMPSVKDNLKLPNLNNALYGRETHHLEGITLNGQPAPKVYHFDTGKNTVIVKGNNGYPWDIKSYDENFIYDWITELDWTNPNDFKKNNPPIKMLPRYWDGDPTNVIAISETVFEIWQNCKLIKNNTIGSVYFEIKGFFNIDFEGDIGSVNTLVVHYFWNGNQNIYQDREQLYLTKEFGWIKWTHAKLINGIYQIDAMTIHNKIILGSIPKFVFPCFQIP